MPPTSPTKSCARQSRRSGRHRRLDDRARRSSSTARLRLTTERNFAPSFSPSFARVSHLAARSRPTTASENRFEKICKIIGECRYGIHDISKTEPDPASGLSSNSICRLSLASSSGAKKFGARSQRIKEMPSSSHRTRSSLSAIHRPTIAGQDIHAHDRGRDGQVDRAGGDLGFVTRCAIRQVPGGRAIAIEYEKFATVIARRLRREAARS